MTNDLERRIPALLTRARALLRLPGGPPDRLSPAELPRAARAVSALHQGLIADRAFAGHATYEDPTHLGAYLLWWWPQTYAKVRLALQLAPHALPASARVLDLGAGPGPAAMALLDAAGSFAHALALDASPAALLEAQRLGGVQAHRHDLTQPLPRLAGGPFDLVCAANVLSELDGSPAQKAALLQAAADQLAPGGVLLTLEPALRETGRALLRVRDLLLQGGLRALAPCFTQLDCPALLAERDWCTAARRWTPPPHLVQLADALGLRADEELSFAWVLFGRERAASGAELFRVVGLPPPEKGKRKLFVCGAAGRAPLVLLDRHRGPATALLDEVERGDVVRLRNLARKGDGLRLSPDSEVGIP